MKKTSYMSKSSSKLSKSHFGCYICCSLVNFKNLIGKPSGKCQCKTNERNKDVKQNGCCPQKDHMLCFLPLLNRAL